jgi:hypothetical protein
LLLIPDQSNLGIFSPGSSPYGKKYSEWAEEWIKWSLSIPKSSTPITDETGKNCAKSQFGPVWFLAGTFGTSVKRKCHIPFSKAIFFPIIEKECSYAEEGSQLKTETDLCKRATSLMDIVIDMKVLIDGNVVENLKKYRARSSVFDLVFPEDNIYGVKAGTTRSVTDGYWLFVKPLSEGNHVIHFMASAAIPEGPTKEIANPFVKYNDDIFRTEVLYELTIFRR